MSQQHPNSPTAGQPYPAHPQVPTAAPASGHAPMIAQDPGKTMGIVGLVLSIVLGLPGLVVSIIARSKSKAAGFTNGLATAGIWVGAIMTALNLLMIPVMLRMLDELARL